MPSSGPAQGCSAVFLNTFPIPGLPVQQATEILAGCQRAGVETTVATTATCVGDQALWDDEFTISCPTSMATSPSFPSPASSSTPLGHESLTVDEIRDILVRVSGRPVGLRRRTPEQVEAARMTVFGQTFQIWAGAKDLRPVVAKAKAAESRLGIPLTSLDAMQSWLEVDAKSAQGSKVIGCKWVFTYKFDPEGFFVNCKARLVARGDQAKDATADTYASKLSLRTLRIMVLLAMALNMTILQFDVVNAYMNTSMKTPMFTRLPPGFRKPSSRKYKLISLTRNVEWKAFRFLSIILV